MNCKKPSQCGWCPQGVRLVAKQGEKSWATRCVHRRLHRSRGHSGRSLPLGLHAATGYNYPLGWLNGGGSQPFRKSIEGSQRIFDQFADRLGFLRSCHHLRFWIVGVGNGAQCRPRKVGLVSDRTPKLVEEFWRLGVRWMIKHPDKHAQRLCVYAGTRIGGRRYLTPTVIRCTEYLKRCNGRCGRNAVGGVAEDKPAFILSPSGQPVCPMGIQPTTCEEGPLAGRLLGKGMPRSRLTFRR